MDWIIPLSAFFWLAAELAILIAMRGALKHLTGEPQGKAPWILGALTLLPFAGLLSLDGSAAAGSLGPVRWNFLCTVWVVLEGLILLYVIRIYRWIKERKLSDSRLPMLILILGMGSLFLLYNVSIQSVARAEFLHREDVGNLYLFYIRICGIFWVAFEWAVAWYGWKMFLWVRREAA